MILTTRICSKLDYAFKIIRSSQFSQYRYFRSSSNVFHRDTSHLQNNPSISINFKDKHGKVQQVEALEGQTILEAAHKHDINLEGACEASLACSTCHVILEKDTFDKLPEPSEQEEDMLDLAYGLTETSRLGCQVIITKELENTTITLPSATRNFYVDGHVPKPH